ncbi:MAG: glycosyltransferase family 2 protein [Propionibacteriaceae bacterium]
MLRPHSDPKVTVIVPALNEAANVREILPQLPPVHEVILVDGNSVDDTIEAARAVMPDIKIIRQTRRGKGNALACGFLGATGDIIVMFDADGSADPTEIPAFVDALLSGADFAKGSRFAPGGGSDDITPLRRAGNSALNLVANRLFTTRFTDLCYGYNAFWADLVTMLDLPDIDQVAPNDDMVWGDGFEIETVINCRFAAADVVITEVASVELPRLHGQTNLRTFTDGARVLRTIMAERQRARRTSHSRQSPVPADRPRLELIRSPGDGEELSSVRERAERNERIA